MYLYSPAVLGVEGTVRYSVLSGLVQQTHGLDWIAASWQIPLILSQPLKFQEALSSLHQIERRQRPKMPTHAMPNGGMTEERTINGKVHHQMRGRADRKTEF
jgi:hypothetical protein